MEEKKLPRTCATCAYYRKEVRDSGTTGASFDARMCNHPRFSSVMGKCPEPDTPGCLLHSGFAEELVEARKQIRPPPLGMFDDNIRGALNLHSFSWQLKQYTDEFLENMGKAEHDYAVNPTGGDRGDLVYRIGYALMRTDRNPLRTELYNIVNDALQAYLEPAFEQSQRAILYHMDYLIAQIEQRYAPLQQEVEELRREVRRLKDEDTDSVRPALRTAVED